LEDIHVKNVILPLTFGGLPILGVAWQKGASDVTNRTRHFAGRWVAEQQMQNGKYIMLAMAPYRPILHKWFRAVQKGMPYKWL